MAQQWQEALTGAYIASLARIRGRVSALLTELYVRPKSWRDADADRYVLRAVPIIEGAQRAIAALTADYLARMVADQTGDPYQPRGIDLDKATGAAVRNGVAPEVVYRRPFEETWASLAEDKRREDALRQPPELSDTLERLEREQAERRARRRDAPTAGQRSERRPRVSVTDNRPKPNEKPLTAAVERGVRRAKTIAMTDLELAATHAAREFLADEPRVKFFRRVLTGAESCGLCVIASTQRYHKEHLMPIHPNCDCGIAPIYGDKDPGKIINSKRVTDDATQAGESRDGVPVFEDDQLIDTDLLTQDVHDAILREFGQMAFDARQLDYRKVLLVQEHGELGPVLTVARHKFTRRQIDQRDLAAPPGSSSDRSGRRR